MVFEQQYHTDIRDMFVREMPETAVQQMNAIMICRLIGEKGPEIQKVTLQLVKVMLKRKKRVSEHFRTGERFDEGEPDALNSDAIVRTLECFADYLAQKKPQVEPIWAGIIVKLIAGLDEALLRAPKVVYAPVYVSTTRHTASTS
jgi:hypothetical protein